MFIILQDSEEYRLQYKLGIHFMLIAVDTLLYLKNRGWNKDVLTCRLQIARALSTFDIHYENA